MVDFECQDGEAVDSPGGSLGVEDGVGEKGDILEQHHVVVVDAFDEVSAVLVGAVDAAFQLEGIGGVDVVGADEILEVPLHGVDPRFFP